MRIGIDCRLWNETGVGRYIRNLVLNLQEIDKQNNYVLFVLPKDFEQVKSIIRSPQFIVEAVNIRWHTIKEQIKFPSILNKNNLDLVHFPYFAVPIFYNRPFVVTIHDLIQYHFSSGQASTLPLPVYNLKLLGYKFVLSKACQKAKNIITVSNATKQEITNHLRINPSKISVIYEGIDGNIENSKLKDFSSEKYFLYVGNAYPHKNLKRLLKAFISLNSDAKLVLVLKKDNFYNKLKQEVKRLDLSENIIFLQNVSDRELGNLYKKALALILPSLMEGFGLPALEAMANNCLVLVSSIPSFKEVCGDAAIYFDPNDINDIAKKITEVYSNDTYYYSDKKKRGLERAKLFSWKKMARETLMIYNELNFA
jgi:glycosyltransferase involved in cell wall biosynthesis